MNLRYSMPCRVTSYDCDPSRRLRLSAMLRLIQEVAGRHLDGEGQSYEQMAETGYVFLLAKQALRVKRQPCYNEEFNVETWYRQTKGAQFLRDVCFRAADGSPLVEASGAWILVDPHTHHILRPSVFPLEEENRLPGRGLVELKKIVLPQGMEHAGERQVRYSDIDCNGHMNNAVYADIACDYFPGSIRGRDIKSFDIAFLNEALEGGTIEISTCASGGAAYFEGVSEGKKCFEAVLQAE